MVVHGFGPGHAVMTSNNPSRNRLTPDSLPRAMLLLMACSECGADRGHLFGCTQSSIQIRTPEAPTLGERIAQDEAAAVAPSAFEQYRLFAFPLAFVVMWLFSASDFGRFILRTFFGMWLHELGARLGVVADGPLGTSAASGSPSRSTGKSSSRCSCSAERSR